MPRTKGSTASKPCGHCGFQSIIIRDKTAFDYVDNAYDGAHTCYDADGKTFAMGVSRYKAGIEYICTAPEHVKCPECQGPMVSRTARKGKHIGETFWGCKKYPNCKGILALHQTQGIDFGKPTTAEPDFDVNFRWHQDVIEKNNEPTEPEPITEPNMPAQTEPVNITLDFNGAITKIVGDAILANNERILEFTTGQWTNKAIQDLVEETIAKTVTPQIIGVDVTVNNVTIGHVDGTPHMKFERILTSIARRKMSWICGPTGSGKTTAAQMAATALNMDYTEISCGPETDQYELFGHITPDGRYIEGKIRSVFENGGILMLDEIDNSNPSALVSMNTALSNGGAMFPDGYVKRHPDFVCIAGANTWGNGADRQYVGRTEIDAATISRFKFIDFDYDETAERDWAGHDQKEWVDFILQVRHAAFERGLEVIVSPRASINGASELRDGDDFYTIADEYVWNPMSASDKEMLKSAIGWERKTFGRSKITAQDVAEGAVE
tara:strand:- start:8222 stop:9706 length:1485 start_codon:yes stop_codon:yes gene_type:complete